MKWYDLMPVVQPIQNGTEKRKAAMTTKPITIGGREFLKIPLMPVSQKGQRFYIGKVTARKISSIYSVEPSRYNLQQQVEIAYQAGVDDDYVQALRDKTRKSRDNEREGFQRKPSISRVGDIKKELQEDEQALFPSMIVCTVPLVNEHFGIEQLEEYYRYVKNPDDDVRIFSFLEDGECPLLHIPVEKNAILIIDSQYRLNGIKESAGDIQEAYELVLAFILNFNRSTIANIFYKINYTQKSVDKSLLYRLMCGFSQETMEVTFLNEAVKILNELEKSPFYGKIKMLGYEPLVGISSEMKKKAILSQASLIDHLMPLISPMKSNSVFQPIFRKFFLKEDKQIVIIRLIIHYFQSVRDIFPTEWNDPNGNLLTKTVTIGAFIKVFHLLLMMKLHESRGDFQKLEALSRDDFKDLLEGVKNVNFSTDNDDFKKTEGRALLLKIRNEILDNIPEFEIYKDGLSEEFKNSNFSSLKKVKDFL